MNAYTMTNDLSGLGTSTDIVLVIAPIIITLTVALWATRRLILMLATLRQLTQNMANMEQRLVFFRTALDMLARELSDHMNSPHNKKGSLL